MPNFAFNYFLKSAKLDMAYVPYRDAASPLNDLGEGRIQVYATSYATVIPQIQAGKVKVLAMLTRQRIPMAPDIPTTADAGYKHVFAEGFSGLFGWKGMSNELRDRIAADVAAVAKEPELVAIMTKTTQIPRGTTPAEFVKTLDDQRASVAEIIKLIGKPGQK